MTKSVFISFCFVLGLVLPAAAQTMLQEIIVDFTTLRRKEQVVEVTLPPGAKEVFYRITTFDPEKVNTGDALFNALRVVPPTKLQAEGYDLAKHGLVSTAKSGVKAFFFTDLAASKRFKEGSDVACKKLDSTQSVVGKLDAICQSEMLYIGLRPAAKGEPMTVKVEVVAFAPVRVDSSVDKYPYTIRNETDVELVYEISGNRTNWETFYLPALRKAEFRLAASPIYLRVSTQKNKSTVEYQIVADKQYRLYWNKSKDQIDLGEMPKKQ